MRQQSRPSPKLFRKFEWQKAMAVDLGAIFFPWRMSNSNLIAFPSSRPAKPLHSEWIQADYTSRGDTKCHIRNRLNRNFPLCLFKHKFGSAAHWADPTIRKFIEWRVRGDISVRIALFGIVNITANITFPFFHLSLLLRTGCRLFQNLIVIDFFESEFVPGFLIG